MRPTLFSANSDEFLNANAGQFVRLGSGGTSSPSMCRSVLSRLQTGKRQRELYRLGLPDEETQVAHHDRDTERSVVEERAVAEQRQRDDHDDESRDGAHEHRAAEQS